MATDKVKERIMTSRIVNNPALAYLSFNEAFKGLSDEKVSGLGQDELAPLKTISVQSKPISIKLKRTFNLTWNGQVIKYWRVVGPEGHRNYHSDLSIEGLKNWGIIQ